MPVTGTKGAPVASALTMEHFASAQNVQRLRLTAAQKRVGTSKNRRMLSHHGKTECADAHCALFVHGTCGWIRQTCRLHSRHLLLGQPAQLCWDPAASPRHPLVVPKTQLNSIGPTGLPQKRHPNVTPTSTHTSSTTPEPDRCHRS